MVSRHGNEHPMLSAVSSARRFFGSAPSLWQQISPAVFAEESWLITPVWRVPQRGFALF